MSFKEYKTLDLIEISNKISEYWEKDKTFEKSISSRDKSKDFVFFEGPPSANGMPGIHHVMARAIKDIFCRYKTLKGFKVNRKAGWDTHGLPVELGVEKELNISKEEIDTRNQAEQLAFQTEKQMKDLDDKLSEDDKSDLNNALEKLKKANESSVVEDIKSEMENLNSVWSSKASSMYDSSNANTEPKDSAKESVSNSETKDDKKIKDADFEVVED